MDSNVLLLALAGGSCTVLVCVSCASCMYSGVTFCKSRHFLSACALWWLVISMGYAIFAFYDVSPDVSSVGAALARLREAYRAGITWLDKAGPALSTEGVVTLALLEGLVNEGTRLPVALSEVKTLRDRLVASRKLAEEVLTQPSSVAGNPGDALGIPFAACAHANQVVDHNLQRHASLAAHIFGAPVMCVSRFGPSWPARGGPRPSAAHTPMLRWRSNT